jgi:hypothetical protein
MAHDGLNIRGDHGDAQARPAMAGGQSDDHLSLLDPGVGAGLLSAVPPGRPWRQHLSGVSGRRGVAGRQDLQQRRQAATQLGKRSADRRGGRRGCGAGAQDDSQHGRLLVHLAERGANRGTRMVGPQRILPFQRAQQLLPDRVVVGMALGAQARLAERLGPSVKSAEQSPPIDNALVARSRLNHQACPVSRNCRNVLRGL